MCQYLHRDQLYGQTVSSITVQLTVSQQVWLGGGSVIVTLSQEPNRPEMHSYNDILQGDNFERSIPLQQY